MIFMRKFDAEIFLRNTKAWENLVSLIKNTVKQSIYFEFLFRFESKQ